MFAIELAKLPPPTPAVAATTSSIQNGASGFCTTMPSSIAGMSSRPAEIIVQFRPPTMATMNVYGNRRVAPTRLGSEISQNDSAVVSSKPADGSITTTMLHSCQTTKPRNSAKIDQPRFRLAIRLPWDCQNAGSSGVHPSSQRPGLIVGACAGVGPVMVEVMPAPTRSGMCSRR